MDTINNKEVNKTIELENLVFNDSDAIIRIKINESENKVWDFNRSKLVEKERSIEEKLYDFMTSK